MRRGKRTRALEKELKGGVRVNSLAPEFLNSYVREGCVGYVLPLHYEGQQYNMVLEVTNNQKKLFTGNTTQIPMQIHSVFITSPKNDRENIRLGLVGKTVTLYPMEGQTNRIIDPFYRITGIVTLRCKPP